MSEEKNENTIDLNEQKALDQLKKFDTLVVKRDPVAAALSAGQIALAVGEQLAARGAAVLAQAAEIDMRASSIMAAADEVERIASHPTCPPNKRKEAEAAAALRREDAQSMLPKITGLLTTQAQMAENAGIWAAAALNFYKAAELARAFGPEATANPDPEKPRGPRAV